MAAVLLEQPAPHVALVRIHRPEARNALNDQVRAEIDTLLPRLDQDDDIRCVILAGASSVFSAGADIKERANLGPAGRTNMNTRRAISSFSKPLIAAVNGYALGGGCEYAMQCDIIVASEQAKFGQPEVKFGLVPGAGGTQRLPRAVGKYNALYMLLTGNIISARDAWRMGLVCEVTTNDCEPRALEIAIQIAALPPATTRLIKEAVNAGADMSLDAALRFEQGTHQLALTTEDVQEGLTAFQEKRPPRFTGH